MLNLTYHELYERLFDHFSTKDNEQHYYNVLLLAAIVQCFAVDTSVCERQSGRDGNNQDSSGSGLVAQQSSSTHTIPLFEIPYHSTF